MSYEPLGLPYKHIAFEGVPVTPIITPERIEEIRDVHKSRQDDVYIATFLKCGTTWLQQILCVMFDNPQGKQEHINLDIPWIELEDQEHVNKMMSPRIFKTHLKWRWVPKADGVKYIYCYRNPKDVAVSYHHHMQVFKSFYCLQGSFDDFVSNVFLANNAAENGSFFDHVAEWLEQKNNANILFLTYEDMSENFEREIRRIADFLDVELTDEKLSVISEKSSFGSMKGNDRVNYNWFNGTNKDPNTDFIRKGKVGDWINHLSEAQSKEIESLVESRLIPLGANIRYKLD